MTYKSKRQEASDAAFAEKAENEDIDLTCIFGNEANTKEIAKELVENMMNFYDHRNKAPRKGTHERGVAKKDLPKICLLVRHLLTAHPDFCEMKDGKYIFYCRKMEGDEARQPGNYTTIQYDKNRTKHGMTDNVTTGMKGRVDRQIPESVSPYDCSTICITEDEAVELVRNDPKLRDLIDRLLPLLPAFQYNDDHDYDACAEFLNQILEFTLTSTCEQSNGYRTARGYVLERVLNFGSSFINKMCQFPDVDIGDHNWIVNFSGRSVSNCAVGTWSTVPTDAYDAVDECSDELTLNGLWSILKERPKGGFLTLFMYGELFEDLEEEENPLFTGFFDAVKKNPATEVVSGWIDKIADTLDLDLTDEKKAKLCRYYIRQFDNKTKFKNDFHPPNDDVLARETVREMKDCINDAMEMLGSESDATATIYIEQCAIDAISRQSWGPNALRDLMASEEKAKRWIGRDGNVAAKFRLALGTNGQVCFVVIKSSFCPILGQGNVRQYSAKTRIQGVLNYVALVGLHKSAGIISPEHAEKLRRRCICLLITWEGMKGDFGDEQVIEPSKLDKGINQFLPIEYNRGWHVEPGSVALSHQLSPNGMNPYFMALVLARLEMRRFAELIRVLTSSEFDVEDLGGFMDELRVERGNKRDLGLMSEQARQNMRDGHEKSKKKSKKKRSKRKRSKSKKKSEGFKYTGDPSIDITGVPLQDPILRNGRASQYLGVNRNGETARKQWHVKIKLHRERYHLGSYDDEEDAARVYATAAYMHREFGKLPAIRRNNFSSQYKGVTFDRNKWKVTMCIDKEHYHLGSYDDEEDAARVYATAVSKYKRREIK